MVAMRDAGGARDAVLVADNVTLSLAGPASISRPPFPFHRQNYPCEMHPRPRTLTIF